MSRLSTLFELLHRSFMVVCMKYPSGTSEQRLKETYYNGEPSARHQRRIIYMSDDRWMKRGVTDRLKGVLTAYYYARRYGIPFYLNWSEPFDLAEFLVPARYDWRIHPDNIDYSRLSFPLCIESRSSLGWLKKGLDKLIFNSVLHRKNREIHVYTNIGYHDEMFRPLFFELFQPSDKLKHALAGYKFKYWSYSFRFVQLLGDFVDSEGKVLPEDAREALIERNLAELKKLLDDMPAGYKAFVATDSTTFLERAERLDPRVFVVPGTIIHPCTASSAETKSDEFLKTFIDMFLIMNAEKVYRMKTGEMYASQFPKFAARVGGREYVDYRF